MDQKEKFKKICRGMYDYEGSGEEPYRVDTENHTCTCPSWQWDNHKRTKDDLRNCKHLVELKKYESDMKSLK